MGTPLRTSVASALLVILLGCGGGAGSWSFRPDEGDWLVDMSIQSSGCSQTIMRQFHADVDALTSERSAVLIYLATFYDCPAGTWRLPGTWQGANMLEVDDLVDTWVCQFNDRWGIGRFSVRDLWLDFPEGGGYFSGSGAFSGTIDGTPCEGTITFVGQQP